MKAAKGPLYSKISGTESGRQVVHAMIERIIKSRKALANGELTPEAAEPVSIPGVGTFRIQKARRA